MSTHLATRYVDGFRIDTYHLPPDARWDFRVTVTHPKLATKWETFGCGGVMTEFHIANRLLAEAESLLSSVRGESC